MRNFQYVITDEVGIHARPAGLLVKKAKSFPAVITISCGGKKQKQRSLWQSWVWGAKKGSEVTVTVEGEDEDAVSAEMETFSRKTSDKKNGINAGGGVIWNADRAKRSFTESRLESFPSTERKGNR